MESGKQLRHQILEPVVLCEVHLVALTWLIPHNKTIFVETYFVFFCLNNVIVLRVLKRRLRRVRQRYRK